MASTGNFTQVKHEALCNMEILLAHIGLGSLKAVGPKGSSALLWRFWSIVAYQVSQLGSICICFNNT
jgi:hypothetical protein